MVVGDVVFVRPFIVRCLYEAQDVQSGQSRVSCSRSFISPYDTYMLLDTVCLYVVIFWM